jgi:hypothetical protein
MIRNAVEKKTIAKNNSSGVRGVYKNKRTDRWCAQITFQGKTKYLGSFETLQEARLARERGEEIYEDFLERFEKQEEKKEEKQVENKEKQQEKRQEKKPVQGRNRKRETAGEAERARSSALAPA